MLVEFHREYLRDVGLHPEQVEKRKRFFMTHKYNSIRIEDLQFFTNTISIRNKKVCKDLRVFIQWLSMVDSVANSRLPKGGNVFLPKPKTKAWFNKGITTLEEEL